MNLVLFANTKNLEHIEAFVKAAAESQTKPVNGALVVVHQDFIAPARVADLVQPIRGLFPSAAIGTIPVSLNADYPSEGMVGTMFITFIMQAYSKFPGPWLVIDGEGVPKGENFMDALETQHRALGGKITGRGIVEAGSITPVGPITVQLPAKDLKSLLSHTGESWRSRGRYMFGRSGFGLVPAADYLFDLSKADAEQVAGSEPKGKPAAKAEAQPERPVFDPSRLDPDDQAESQRAALRTINPAPGVQSLTQEEINEKANQDALKPGSTVAPGTITPTVDTQKEKAAGVASTQVETGPGVIDETSAQTGPPPTAPVPSPLDNVPDTVPTPDVANAQPVPDSQPPGVEVVTTADGAPGDVIPPEGDGVFIPLSLSEISDGDVAPDASSLIGRPYAELTHPQLFNLMWFRSGEKPHPRIGEATLTKRLEEMDTAAGSR